jgi:predicted dithiol-disulfide oxidoreductase (DUF899 family)
MPGHKIGTLKEWRAARLGLLKDEKELTKRSDELARRRQELPWVRIAIALARTESASVVTKRVWNKAQKLLQGDRGVGLALH